MEESNNETLNRKSDIKNIHTYTSDMADAVRENEASIIKIALAEKDKREQEVIYKEASGTPMTKILLFVGGIVLIGVSLFAAYYVVKRNKDANTPVTPVEKEVDTLISYDSKVLIDASNISTQLDISNALSKEVASVGKPGQVKVILIKSPSDITNDQISESDLLAILKTDIPDALVRSMSGRYMVGTYTDASSGDSESKSHLFIIFEVKDYNQAYASMLAWEKNMLGDLFMLFNINISGDNNYLLEKPWADIVINNKDARLLYDKIGNELLYYAFPDKKTFVITDSSEAIKEITTRLQAKITKPL